MMRATLRRLNATGPLKEIEQDPEKLLPLVRSVWGPDATLQTYRDWCTRWHRLEPLGRWLAEFIVTYGVPPRTLTRDDIDALDIAQPYAHALRCRLAADSAVIADGGIGPIEYYCTFTGGDRKEAKRLREEAIARSNLGG